MAYNYNHVTLVGRLTKAPEQIKISDSLTKTVFFLAVQRRYKKAGEAAITDFIPISFWGKTGALAFDMLKKGMPVLVWGRIQIKSYQVDSKRQWGVEIVAENFQILQSKAPDLTEIEGELTGEEA